MRTTVDIPDPTYRALKVRAAAEGTTVKALILRGVSVAMGVSPEAAAKRRVGPPPVLRSKSPGSLKLGENGVYDYIPFP
jgi:hypothetical protein